MVMLRKARQAPMLAFRPKAPSWVLGCLELVLYGIRELRNLMISGPWSSRLLSGHFQWETSNIPPHSLSAPRFVPNDRPKLQIFPQDGIRVEVRQTEPDWSTLIGRGLFRGIASPAILCHKERWFFMA